MAGTQGRRLTVGLCSSEGEKHGSFGQCSVAGWISEQQLRRRWRYGLHRGDLVQEVLFGMIWTGGGDTWNRKKAFCVSYYEYVHPGTVAH